MPKRRIYAPVVTAESCHVWRTNETVCEFMGTYPTREIANASIDFEFVGFGALVNGSAFYSPLGPAVYRIDLLGYPVSRPWRIRDIAENRLVLGTSGHPRQFATADDATTAMLTLARQRGRTDKVVQS